MPKVHNLASETWFTKERTTKMNILKYSSKRGHSIHLSKPSKILSTSFSLAPLNKNHTSTLNM